MSGETPKVFGSESENPDAEGLRQRTAIEVKHEEKSNPSMAEAPSTAEPPSKKEMFGLERKNSSQKALLLIVFINSVRIVAHTHMFRLSYVRNGSSGLRLLHQRKHPLYVWRRFRSGEASGRI